MRSLSRFQSAGRRRPRDAQNFYFIPTGSTRLDWPGRRGRPCIKYKSQKGLRKRVGYCDFEDAKRPMAKGFDAKTRKTPRRQEERRTRTMCRRLNYRPK
jgi:hypothetical protein